MCCPVVSQSQIVDDIVTSAGDDECVCQVEVAWHSAGRNPWSADGLFEFKRTNKQFGWIVAVVVRIGWILGIGWVSGVIGDIRNRSAVTVACRLRTVLECPGPVVNRVWIVRINFYFQDDSERLRRFKHIARGTVQHVRCSDSAVTVVAVRHRRCVDVHDRDTQNINERSTKLSGQVISQADVGQCFGSCIRNKELIGHVEVANGSTGRGDRLICRTDDLLNVDFGDGDVSR